jgi:probable HAF family extracellular repeat protein
MVASWYRAAFIAACLVASSASQANRYTLVDLGPNVFPFEINNEGQIAATTNAHYPLSNQRALAWRFDHWHRLDERAAQAYSIDSDGTAGGSALGSKGRKPYTWGVEGVRYGFTLPRGNHQGAVTRVKHSRAVGWYYPHHGNGVERCFSGGSHGGATEDLGLMAGMNNCIAIDMNAAGQIIGTSEDPEHFWLHGFILKDGVFTNLGALGGEGLPTSAYAINDAGHVVGYSLSTNPGDLHAFMWKDGVMTDIGNDPPRQGSAARSINNEDVAVGNTVAGSSARAVRFEGGQVFTLDDEVDHLDGWKLEVAYSINDSGVIVGYGALSGHKLERGFALIPIP